MAEFQPSLPSVDFREILRVLMRRQRLVLLPWVVALVIGIGMAFLLRPVYFSSVTLILERQRPVAEGERARRGSNIPDQQADVMREQVKSSLFLHSVVAASGISSEASTRAWALKSAKKYPGLSPDEQVDRFLVDHLRTAVTIKQGRGNVFNIIVADSRPDRARLFAGAVANQFVISSKAAQLEAVRAVQEFSVEQQRIYKQKLTESENRLEEFRSARLSRSTGPSGSEASATRARTLLNQAERAVEEQRQRVASLQGEFQGRVKDDDPERLTSPETLTLSAQLSGLERQLATSLLLEGPGGDEGAAARLAISHKTAELELALIHNVAVALPGSSPEVRDLLVRYRIAQADLQAKEARQAYLRTQVGALEQRAVTAPDRELELQWLTQEVENNRALYNSFLQQSAAAQISEAFEHAKLSGRFIVLEPATLPRSPGKPNRPMLILLSLVLGGVIGVGSALIVEQHDQSVKNADEVESLLGLPVLGAVPRVQELERARRRPRTGPSPFPTVTTAREFGLLQRLKVESPLGLEFRRVYLKLAKSHGRALPGTLLVTSSTRGEGKTTTSACLAITLARELNEKMLLVDFDLRSPALHRALGLPTSSWGLTQMLQQMKFDERFVRSTVIPQLDFLPAGKSERPAAELLGTDEVEWFLREARARYSHVLIDSAPTLAVPDPLILGRAVEGVIYVIKAGSTIRKAAEYGVKVQREARDNVLGVLMNDIGEVLPHYYGYHDAYGYTSEVAGGEP